jgi:hypothetical protein
MKIGNVKQYILQSEGVASNGGCGLDISMDNLRRLSYPIVGYGVEALT